MALPEDFIRNPEMVSFEVDEIVPIMRQTISKLKDSISNTEELLADHLDRLGETTRKNINTAAMYRSDIVELNELIGRIDKMMGGIY